MKSEGKFLFSHKLIFYWTVMYSYTLNTSLFLTFSAAATFRHTHVVKRGSKNGYNPDWNDNFYGFNIIILQLALVTLTLSYI